MQYRYDMLQLWTSATVADVEELLHRELGGEFYEDRAGNRGLLFGEVPGDVTVRVPRHMTDEGNPDLVVFIDDRDDDRLVEVQQRIALDVFDALSKATHDRIELTAEDDTIVRSRPATRAA